MNARSRARASRGSDSRGSDASGTRVRVARHDLVPRPEQLGPVGLVERIAEDDGNARVGERLHDPKSVVVRPKADARPGADVAEPRRRVAIVLGDELQHLVASGLEA